MQNFIRASFFSDKNRIMRNPKFQYSSFPMVDDNSTVSSATPATSLN